MHDPDVVERLARFAGRLRERGVGVCVSDEIDGAAALLLVDLGDRDEVRYALRAALKVRRSDWDTFDELFRDFWGGRGPASRTAGRGGPSAGPVGPGAGPADPGGRTAGPAVTAAFRPQRPGPPMALAPGNRTACG